MKLSIKDSVPVRVLCVHPVPITQTFIPARGRQPQQLQNRPLSRPNPSPNTESSRSDVWPKPVPPTKITTAMQNHQRLVEVLFRSKMLPRYMISQMCKVNPLARAKKKATGVNQTADASN